MQMANKEYMERCSPATGVSIGRNLEQMENGKDVGGKVGVPQ